MGIPRTTVAVLAVAGTPTPVYSGTVLAAASFSIKGGVATIVLTPALPANGYNGPNLAIQGYPAAPAGGQQVTLWGFTTATYFNGKVVSVIGNNPAAKSFSFYSNHADVNSTNDAGNTAACPFQHFRAVRIECGQLLATDKIFVGDLNVSATRYVACLSLAGQLSVEVASDNIPADRIFVTTDGTSNAANDFVDVSLIY